MNEYEDGVVPTSTPSTEDLKSADEPALPQMSPPPLVPQALEQASPSPPVTLHPEPPPRDTARARSVEPKRANPGASDRHAPARAIGVLLSLTVGTLGAALPAMALIWLVFAILATGIAAEALEQTGGLVPTTFGGGYWFAIAIDSLTVLACIVFRMLGAAHPWRPIVWLAGIYGLLIWFLVPLDWTQSWDSPDVLTTFAIVGAHMLVIYVLPFVLLGLLVSGVKSAWLTSAKSAEAAGRIILLGLCLGLFGASVAGSLYAAGINGYFAQRLPSDEELEPLETFGVEEERRSYLELAAEIGPPAPERYAEAYDHGVQRGFHQCAEELAGDGDRSATRREVERLLRQGMSRDDAHDTVMDTLLRVCLKYVDTDIDELRPYFHEAVCRNSMKQYRRSRSCSLDEETCACDDDSQLVESVRREELQAVRAAMDDLSLADRTLLGQRHESGLSYAELAALSDASEGAVRQRVKRARDRLRKAFERRQ